MENHRLKSVDWLGIWLVLLEGTLFETNIYISHLKIGDWKMTSLLAFLVGAMLVLGRVLRCLLKKHPLTTPNIDLEKEKCGVRQNVRFFWEYTLPETNIAPKKLMVGHGWTTFVLERPIFKAMGSMSENSKDNNLGDYVSSRKRWNNIILYTATKL